MNAKHRATGMSCVVAVLLGLSAPAGAVIWDPDGEYERQAAIDRLERMRERAAGPFAAIRVEERRIGVDQCELAGPVIASRGPEPRDQSTHLRISVPCVGKPTEQENDSEAGGFISCGSGPAPVLSNERVATAKIVVVPRRAHVEEASVSVGEILFFDDARAVPSSPYDGQIANAEAELRRLLSVVPGEPGFPNLPGSTWMGEHPSGLVLELHIGQQVGDELLVGMIQASHRRPGEQQASRMSPSRDALEQTIFKDHTDFRTSFVARLLRESREYAGGFDPIPGSGGEMALRLRMLETDEVELTVRHMHEWPSSGSTVVLRRAEGPMSDPEHLTAPVALGGTGELVMGPEGLGPPTFDSAPSQPKAPEVKE